ncbi:MAG TPA: bifunctional DNA-formamidopyrimidine glycosylase/DNA-(apurinic or apyrimidinic site) lyase [Anaerolineales bacterium]|nr:bifunctional DNA-formamidopyrimidine glycosylase/DNA-(apurinic or apyrimidinic site) lyase [Anaerolineales bacterium]
MPELPEVETIVRQLRTGDSSRPPLPGRTIDRVTIRWPRHIATPEASEFRRAIAGRVIREVDRRGKYLVFPLDVGTMLIHLKMSGDLTVAPTEEPAGRFDHTVFHLDGGWDLRFGDSRKFGKVFLLDDPDIVLTNLGPEPLDTGFTAAILGERLRQRARALKPLLLDQSFVAGLGNIYVDEALHRARLHPLRRSDRLRDDEVRRLWRGIRASLRSGLRHNGASIDWVYRGGGFQNHFRVYQRAGEPCGVCGTTIRRIVVGQRSTHYCPKCQPRRRR